MHKFVHVQVHVYVQIQTKYDFQFSVNDELCSIIGTEVTNSIANEPANVQLCS